MASIVLGNQSSFDGSTLTWTTFKFKRNQLGTVLAYVMISVPWSNQRAYQVISEKLLSKEFHCRTTDHK